MKSVAFIHPFVFRYSRGIERYIVNLSSALVQQDINVDILTWGWPNPIAWSELDSRVKVKIFPEFKYFASKMIVPFYVMHLLRYQYDQIFINFSDYGEATALNILRLLGKIVPLTIVLHYPYSQVPHRYHAFTKSGLASAANEIIAVHNFVAREAESVFHRQCKVIPNGVNTDIFSPNIKMRKEVRDELRINKDSPLLLSVCALEERKGVQWMLNALPESVKRLPDIHYLIVGEGSYRFALEQLVDQLGLSDNVSFLGEKTDTFRYYQGADLLIFLSKGEAFGIVVLEAMSCCLPVIVSRHPPFDELVQPAWGFSTNETDITAIVNAVELIIKNPEKREAMGIMSRDFVWNNYTWNIAARAYKEIIR